MAMTCLSYLKGPFQKGLASAIARTSTVSGAVLYGVLLSSASASVLSLRLSCVSGDREMHRHHGEHCTAATATAAAGDGDGANANYLHDHTAALAEIRGLYASPMDAARIRILQAVNEEREEEERKASVAMERVAETEWFAPFLFPWERPILSVRHQGQPIGPLAKAYWLVFGMVVAGGSANSMVRRDKERLAPEGGSLEDSDGADVKRACDTSASSFERE